MLFINLEKVSSGVSWEVLKWAVTKKGVLKMYIKGGKICGQQDEENYNNKLERTRRS